MQSRPLTKLILSYGKGTVIITGATRGLGPAYCFKLIEAGFLDFVIIDENKQELISLIHQMEEHASQLKNKVKNLQIQPFECDLNFSYQDPEKFGIIENFMTQLCKEKEHISIMVNNCGMLQEEKFDTLEYQQIQEQINRNISSLTFMIRFIIQKMQSQKFKSAIINIGSSSAVRIQSNQKSNSMLYKASKRYEEAMTSILQAQYPTIDFMNDMPLTFDIHKKDLNNLGFQVTPKRHVQNILRALGNKDCTHGTLRHSFMLYCMSNFYNFNPPV